MTTLPHPSEQDRANIPTATQHYHGDIITPDFSGKITGRNAPENNYEDQRSMDNYVGTLMERKMFNVEDGDFDSSGNYR